MTAVRFPIRGIRGRSVVVAAMLSGLPSAAGRAPESTGFDVFKRQITENIAKVRTGATPEIRADAAEHLADLTSGTSDWVADNPIADMVSLLDTQEDPVRFWVAVTLGNLGYGARRAIPKLQELLSRADCLWADLSEADAIRYALARMHAAVPPPTCGRAEAKAVLFKKLLTKTIAIAGKGETLDIQRAAAGHQL